MPVVHPHRLHARKSSQYVIGVFRYAQDTSRTEPSYMLIDLYAFLAPYLLTLEQNPCIIPKNLTQRSIESSC